MGIKILYYLSFINLAFLLAELAFNVSATLFWGKG
jgi:hypothetical protein